MIKVVNLKKSYGRLEALKSISFEVEKGSVFGFIGRNGAGKTTTMNILTGLIKFNGGKIFIKGKDFLKNKQELVRSIGYLPETPTFYNYMNTYEYLNFIARIIGCNLKKTRKSVGKLLEMVKLTKQGKRRIGGYSRGMKQRLALAVAFMNSPEILFLDEPASALDPEGRVEMLELIEGLKDDKITIFLSTHILNDAERVCDKICIIDEGKILLTKNLSQLYETYIQPIFDVEFEEDPEDEVNLLKKFSWIESIKENGRRISIYVKDIDYAKKEILKELSKLDNNITSYRTRKSTLEDIFIRMVSKNEII
ncbi:MAG: ABC transporter ATP-binding protein [Candidatus Hydromicrobium americanum]|nr:MAG: ABC transporter ATP-binding protein [Candidatus Hydromicrobium americanum]